MNSIGRGRANLMPAWMSTPQQPGGIYPPPTNQTYPNAAYPPVLPQLMPQTQYQASQYTPAAQYPPVASYPQPYGGQYASAQIPPPYAAQAQMQYPAQASYPAQMQYPTPAAQYPPRTAVDMMRTGGWVEAKTPEGRIYFYNSQTGESTFEKPDQLKTAAERQLPFSPWKEYVKEGRSYFVNSKTKESVWEEPMEFTTHRERIKALCAGEAPTKDQASLAIYRAAKQALEELVIDVDGSLAKKKAEEEARAQAAEESRLHELQASRKLQLSIIPDKVVRREIKEYPWSNENGKEVFLRMLSDWDVSATATWDEAFSKGIANDPRYTSISTLEMKEQLVRDRRKEALSRESSAESDYNRKKAEFEAYLDNLENRKILNHRSNYAALHPLMQIEKKLTLHESEAKKLFDNRIQNILERFEKEKKERESKLEGTVHDALKAFEVTETSTKEELMELLKNSGFVSNLKPEEIRRYCQSYIRKLVEKRENLEHEALNQAKKALKEGLLKAFSNGAISVESRWADFRSDEDLRTTRAPWLVELLLPFAGNESVVEEIFRDARDLARDLVADAGQIIRENGWNLTNITRLEEFSDPNIVEILKTLENKFGKGILERSIQEQSKRYPKDKERFFELLRKYVRDQNEAAWEKIQPLICDRTAYKDMYSDIARKDAFEEYVQNLGKKPKPKSRSPPADRKDRDYKKPRL